MNGKPATIIAAATALAACAVGWVALPALQGSQQAVEREASMKLERARRLLHEYSAAIAYESLLSKQLDGEIAELDPSDISSDLEDEYQELHAAMWEAYTPTDWPQHGGSPRKARANYGNVSNQMQQGLNHAAVQAGRNVQLLDQAYSAVKESLAVTSGDESSRSYTEANRLEGTVLYYMGLARRVEARLHRRETDAYRRQLVALTIEANADRAAQSLVEQSEVDARINELQDDAADLEAAINADQEAIAVLDTRLQELQERIDAAESRRSDALRAMDALKAEGIDFADPQGGERFSIRLTSFDKAFREADRTIRALRSGDFPNADIDQSGDFLTGQYVEHGASAKLTVEYGTVHYRSERAVLATALAGKQAEMRVLRSDLARLEGIRAAYTATQARAAKQEIQAAKTAEVIYAELNRVDSEAFEMEDEALDLLDQAAGTARRAAEYANQWIRDARDHTQGLSPAAKSRSAFDGRLRDGWMGGFIAAEEADARLAKAWIYYERFDEAKQNADVLAKASEALGLKEADVDAEHQKLTEAHDAGLEEVTKAISALESAHRGSERHWTLTAQAAGATYLLSLFGHEGYVADAIETYRDAVKGRENEAYAGTFVARLNRLEERR